MIFYSSQQPGYTSHKMKISLHFDSNIGYYADF